MKDVVNKTHSFHDAGNNCFEITATSGRNYSNNLATMLQKLRRHDRTANFFVFDKHIALQ